MILKIKINIGQFLGKLLMIGLEQCFGSVMGSISTELSTDTVDNLSLMYSITLSFFIFLLFYNDINIDMKEWQKKNRLNKPSHYV